MILTPHPTLCILVVTNCLVTGCDSQELNEANTWQPDMAAISTNNIVWGIETNHVKVGLNIQYASGITDHTLVGFYVVMYNNSDTNGGVKPNLLTLGIPPEHSRYKMNLFDDKGNEIPKTEMGKSLDQPLDLHPKITDRHHGYSVKDVSPFCMEIMTYNPIVLGKYFQITNAGKYNLKFVLNTYTKVDSSGIQPFYLPVNADIEIKKP